MNHRLQASQRHSEYHACRFLIQGTGKARSKGHVTTLINRDQRALLERECLEKLRKGLAQLGQPQERRRRLGQRQWQQLVQVS